MYLLLLAVAVEAAEILTLADVNLAAAAAVVVDKSELSPRRRWRKDQ